VTDMQQAVSLLMCIAVNTAMIAWSMRDIVREMQETRKAK